MKLIYCLLFCISSIGLISPETVEYEDGTFLVFNLNIFNENSTQLSRFSNYTTIGFLNSSLPPMTARVLESLPQTVNFACRDGILAEFEIVPRFREVQLHSCQTINVTIEPGRDYELNALAIAGSDVEELPKNVRYLTKLERLYVAETMIGHVEMDELVPLVNLRQLYLIDSRIKTISSASRRLISMPTLRDLNLSGNQLSMISFTSWDAKLLEKISLRQNRLQIILVLPYNFPKLEKVDLSNNPLDCLWLANFRETIKKQRAELWENTNCNI